MRSLPSYNMALCQVESWVISVKITAFFRFLCVYIPLFMNKKYFCGQGLLLLMDAYFRVCVIFATRVRKALI